jgi:hypothetical protein
MKRALLGFLAGLLGWVLVASLLDRLLRKAIEGYAQAEPTLAFTLGMKVDRLVLGVAASLAAGALVRWIAPSASRAPWILGCVILALFLPVHIKLWTAFPVWYHLTFLLSILPCVVLGSRIARPARTA